MKQEVNGAAGKLVAESIIETKAATILQFTQGLRGNLHVTFEEGTWAAWLYDLLKPHVTKSCNSYADVPACAAYSWESSKSSN
jgi:hypothetical protein